MKRLLCTLALFFAIPVISVPAAPPAAAAVPATFPKQSEVLIARESPVWLAPGQVETAYGTGSCIAYENGKSLLLTNAHVAKDPLSKYKVWFKTKEYKATYLSGMKVTEDLKFLPNGTVSITQDFEDDVDLALLVVSVEIPVVEISAKNAVLDTTLHQWGFSGFKNVEDAPRYRTGKVSPVATEKHTTSNVPSAPGDSGSGQFNDKGELVAVTAWGTESDPDRHTIAMSALTVRKFLKDRLDTFPKLRLRLVGVVQMPK